MCVKFCFHRLTRGFLYTLSKTRSLLVLMTMPLPNFLRPFLCRILLKYSLLSLLRCQSDTKIDPGGQICAMFLSLALLLTVLHKWKTPATTAPAGL